MRYSTTLERERRQERAERQRWMTLVEATKYIRDKQHLVDYDALEDLFRAIVDGRLRALSGDVTYEQDSLSGYDQVPLNDLQGELRICLNGPGYIKFDSCLAKTKNRRTNKIEYPKIKIVAGPVVKLNFDNTDLYNPRPIPMVNDYDYWPLLVSRNDMDKWPFAPDEEPGDTRPASREISESAVPVMASTGVETTTSKRLGRPPGSGSWARGDAPLLTKMRELIESGVAKSPNDAARHVAGEARGNGTTDSKIARLARRYRTQHSSERK